MSVNDDREMLEAAKAECVRLERENARLVGELASRVPSPVEGEAKETALIAEAHEYGDSFTGMLCGAMVTLADGNGDQCGKPADDPIHVRTVAGLLDKAENIVLYGFVSNRDLRETARKVLELALGVEK